MISCPMRCLVLLLACVMAPVGLAQDVVPDTTNPAMYYPLAVGNQWEYEPDGGSPTPYATHFRRTILGDTLINGKTWFIQRNQGFRGPGYGWERMIDGHQVLRFDPDSAAVLWWRNGEVGWWIPCRMDGPTGQSECEPGRQSVYRNKYPTTVTVGGDQIETVGLSFDGAIPGPNLAAGIGALGGECEVACAPVLAYASVGDSTYGDPLDEMPNVPDLTPPWLYYPLEVGNVWEYEVFKSTFENLGETSYQRHEIDRDTIADGKQYFAQVRRDLTDRNTWSEIQSTTWFRFDTTSTRVMVLADQGVEYRFTCPLGADFRSPFDFETGEDPTCGVLESGYTSDGLSTKSLLTSSDSGESYIESVGFSGW